MNTYIYIYTHVHTQYICGICSTLNSLDSLQCGLSIMLYISLYPLYIYSMQTNPGMMNLWMFRHHCPSCWPWMEAVSQWEVLLLCCPCVMCCNVTASGCRRQWSHYYSCAGGKESTEFTGALSQGGVDGKRRQKVETGNIIIGEIKYFSFLCALTFVRGDMKESIALKQLFHQETQQQAESCIPEGYLQHEMHATSV